MTLVANAAGQPAPTVSPSGYFVPAASFTAKFNQQSWIDFFVKSDNPTKALDPTALAALDQMIAFCRAHGIELYLIVGPNHPWDDYRLLSLGYWPALESWMRLLANHPNAIGFSYYAIPETPRYWNDPLHFNTVLGQLIMRLFLDTRSPELPSNVLQPLTPDTIEAVLNERKRGLSSWSLRNPEYPAEFDRTKTRTLGLKESAADSSR